MYKANNGIGNTASDAIYEKIPLYLQQLFYSLIDGFRNQKKPKLVIESEFALLDESLKRELNVFSEETSSSPTTLELSPFVKSFCEKGQIVVMKECIWIIAGAELEEIRSIEGAVCRYSETHYFPLSNASKVSLKLYLSRTGNKDNVFIGFEITETAVPVDVQWAAICDEAGWNRNNNNSFGLKRGSSTGYIAFKDSFINTVGMNMLTIRVALHLIPHSM